MELNVKEQTDKLQEEIAQLNVQLQQVEQVRNNIIIAIAKKQGAVEHLQGLTSEEKPAIVEDKK